MAFYFKTQGREYSFTLEHDGLLHANELDLKAETLAELQELVKAHVKAEKSAPRIPVIILDDRWNFVAEWTPGSASSKADRRGYRWISYKDGSEEKAKTQRRTIDQDRLVVDTPENREKADQVVAIGNEIVALMNRTKEIRRTMLTIPEHLEQQAEAETL